MEGKFASDMPKQSFVERLRAARETLKPSDRWIAPLRQYSWRS